MDIWPLDLNFTDDHDSAAAADVTPGSAQPPSPSAYTVETALPVQGTDYPVHLLSSATDVSDVPDLRPTIPFRQLTVVLDPPLTSVLAPTGSQAGPLAGPVVGSSCAHPAFACSECARVFTRLHNLRTHINEKHNPAFVPYSCPRCHATYKRKNDLKRHRTRKNH
ncbi:hypothetical protein C8Q74DRAFT_1372177 [Fomes fomentarius]|nr:hypothetical protein C8Q74DRAFT_1372177 [Fomes fomentarius]